MPKLVNNVGFNEEHVFVFSPMRLQHRQKDTSLDVLGACVVTFDSDDSTDQVVMEVEEVIYVVDGELTLSVEEPEASYTVTGVPGDVLTLERGAKVRYTGSPATKLFLTFGPR